MIHGNTLGIERIIDLEDGKIGILTLKHVDSSNEYLKKPSKVSVLYLCNARRY